MGRNGIGEVEMTKQKALDLLLLLSALESWSFSAQAPMPDYLHDRLSQTVTELSEEVLR